MAQDREAAGRWQGVYKLGVEYVGWGSGHWSARIAVRHMPGGRPGLTRARPEIDRASGGGVCPGVGGRSEEDGGSRQINRKVIKHVSAPRV